MTVASSSAEVETKDGRFIRNLGTPRCLTSGEDRHLAKSILAQQPFEEDDVTKNVRRK